MKKGIRIGAAAWIICAAMQGKGIAVPQTLRGLPTDAVEVTGAVEKSEAWNVVRLKKEFASEIKTISYTLKGKPGTAQCIPLLAVIQGAKPKFNPKIKNHSLAFFAVVKGEDGYTAVFSLGELLPQYGKRSVWVALDRDGEPFPEKEGPVQLIVPEDEKPSRWIHAVRTIALRDGRENADAKRKK